MYQIPSSDTTVPQHGARWILVFFIPSIIYFLHQPTPSSLTDGVDGPYTTIDAAFGH